MLLLKFWQHTPFFAKQRTFKTLQPFWGIWYSCLSKVIEKVTNQTLVLKKLVNPIFQVITTLNSGFTDILRSFFKISSCYLCFGCSHVPFRRKSMLSISFQDIGIRFAAFYTQLNWLQNFRSRFLNFFPTIYLEPQKLKKLKYFF